MNVAHTLISLPIAIWTVALGVTLIYWLFVMIGLVHLGEGGEGAIEGAAKGAAEAIGQGMDGGGHPGLDLDHAGADHAGGDGADGADAGDAADADNHPGALASLLGALNLRKVPATLSLSLLVFFSWAASLLIHLAAVTATHGELAPWLQWLCALVIAPTLSLPLTSIVVRPLAPLFAHKKAKSAKDMIGRVCIVRTGEVSETFGEAVVKDTGADLILRVRVDGKKLSRGDEGLIVGWDPEREEYLVEPLDIDLRSKQ